MRINVKGKDRELRFGIRFVKNLDAIYKATVRGLEFSAGIDYALGYLSSSNPAGVCNILESALYEERGITTKDVEEFVETCCDYDGLVQELIDEIKKQPMLKGRAEEVFKKA